MFSLLGRMVLGIVSPKIGFTGHLHSICYTDSEWERELLKLKQMSTSRCLSNSI